MKKILVTGGAGFIGSHTAVELLKAGYEIKVIDNLSNSSAEALDRVKQITGKDPDFSLVDIRDRDALDRIFRETPIDAVIHFAGHKAVGESVQLPLKYYDNNFRGTYNLLAAMKEAGCRNMVFSSSCTVYGDPARVPITEDLPLSAKNPYGRSKLYIEEMCRDLVRAEQGWHIALLRYFNPVGGHESGLIGEDPVGIPNNVMPYIMQVAVGRLPFLNIFGNDYPTPDGTGVRDYIHVVDLALGHLCALDALGRIDGAMPINLGTGQGYSVLELVAAAEKASGRPIPYRIAPRRTGDAATVYAEPALAKGFLGWTATRGLDDMCADSWRFQSLNPDGYGKA
jgi:UDP-glucose 4-epimerase